MKSQRISKANLQLIIGAGFDPEQYVILKQNDKQILICHRSTLKQHVVYKPRKEKVYGNK